MGFRSSLAAHPRLVAWVLLCVAFGILIGLTSLGRPLSAGQYAGLIAVAFVTAAITVALAFGDEADRAGPGGPA